MARTQYIFIDYENVCENDLSRVIGKPVRVLMMLGARHKKLPVSLFLFAQDHPDQIRIIQTPVIGPNALDFVLTCELGKLVATDPEGYFHIISKDNDFKAPVQHLKSQKVRIARHESLDLVPALRNEKERFDHLRAELKNPDKGRPKKRQALHAKIQSVFDKTLSQENVEEYVRLLTRDEILTISESDNVSYAA